MPRALRLRELPNESEMKRNAGYCLLIQRQSIVWRALTLTLAGLVGVTPGEMVCCSSV